MRANIHPLFIILYIILYIIYYIIVYSLTICVMDFFNSRSSSFLSSSSFHPGNAAFANSFVAAATQQQVVPPMWRVVHYHDPVPRAPPSFGKLYPVVHPPLEIYYTDRASTQYLVCGSSAEQPHHDKGGDSGGTQENTSSLCMGGFPLYLSLNTDHISYLNESFAFKNFPAACKATNSTTTA